MDFRFFEPAGEGHGDWMGDWMEREDDAAGILYGIGGGNALEGEVDFRFF